ncbi:MAG: alpha/beta hydrolase [Edaphocola sp.]
MGQGKRLIIAFHGFGNDASLFLPIAEKLCNEYTLVSVDIPGHGGTKWLSPYFAKKDLMAVGQGIRNEFSVEKFSLLGYSLGARMALSIVELQADWVDNLVLLAPDGLEKNFWHRMATGNPLGRQLFIDLMRNPKRYQTALAYLRKYNLVDKTRYKFAMNYIENETERKRLMTVWPTTRKIAPAIPIVKWHLEKQQVKTTVFMGKHDRIIPANSGERFIKGLTQARLTVLDCGHAIINETNTPVIATAFE